MFSFVVGVVWGSTGLLDPDGRLGLSESFYFKAVTGKMCGTFSTIIPWFSIDMYLKLSLKIIMIGTWFEYSRWFPSRDGLT